MSKLFVQNTFHRKSTREKVGTIDLISRFNYSKHLDNLKIKSEEVDANANGIEIADQFPTN
jgi:acyl-CoA-binding protein